MASVYIELMIAYVIGDFAVVGEEVADPLAAFSVLAEGGEAFGDGEGLLFRGHAGEALAFADGVGELGAVEFFERGLVVEGVHLAGGAGLAEIDDALGAGGEMGGAGDAGGVAGAVVGGERGGEAVPAEKGQVGHGAEGDPAGVVEEMAAGDAETVFG